MTAFRLLLATIFIVIAAYTAIVVSNHGLGLLPVFFGDIAKVAWPGQFNLDFMCFLALSALWLAWRHHFKPVGLILGLAGFLGGAFFLSAYLLIMSFKVKGDINLLLVGQTRSNGASA
ncbi:hypothetical protein A3765_06220 [Oleiphilus sp. HI0130]|nr:hypothetical protein A3750_06935 [Oleiphilus sp. HI0079]KZZ41947.1 hypothetical protein A3758_15720 [Oleiphilus sp. HI0118]KZZ65115.1 hypothetical protein A3765_06220 [Oleiphilus sp. HI0130]